MKDALMETNILKFDKFITVVQPEATVQERLSTDDVWNAIRHLQQDYAKVQRDYAKVQQDNAKVQQDYAKVRHDLVEETRGRLLDKEEHENAVAKLEKRLEGTPSQQDELKALRLEVKRLEQRLEDERQKREVKEEKSEQKEKKQAGEIERLNAGLKATQKRIESVRTS